jgi:hypothetical protein
MCLHALSRDVAHDEKLLMTSSVTPRRRTHRETFLACVEEARQDALEVAKEADAPSQAGTEDAATIRAAGPSHR